MPLQSAEYRSLRILEKQYQFPEAGDPDLALVVSTQDSEERFHLLFRRGFFEMLFENYHCSRAPRMLRSGAVIFQDVLFRISLN